MRFALPSARHMQHPLVRVLASIVALAVLAVMVVFGALILAAMVGAGLLWYAWFRWRVYRAGKRAAKGDTGSDPTDPNVIEGEYTVVHENRHGPPD